MDQTTEPKLDDSLSGKLNGYVFRCNVVEQQMYYAACLARMSAVQGKDVVPQDWIVCKSACGSRTCQAQKMRDEEVAAGKPIYFLKRGVIQTVTEAVRRWVDAVKPAKAETRGRKAKSLVEGMGSAPTYTEAISKMATAAEGPSKPVVSAALKRPTIVALPGETPLQMARRLLAERKGATA